MIKTLSVIRHFVFLKFNFNNSSLTRLILLLKFFESLKSNKACNAYPFTIKAGIFCRPEYWNVLFSIKLAKLLKVQRKLLFPEPG